MTSPLLRHLALAATFLVVGTACVSRTVGNDPVEVAARYPHVYGDQCSAYLKSHTSGHTYCSSPPFKVASTAPVAAKAEKKDGPTDKDSLVAAGEKIYNTTCAACHQGTGMGVPGAFPPLAGSGEFYGPPKKMAKILVGGLTGEITVQGNPFNGVMPSQGHMSDYDIAAVATFVRHSWGNNDGVVLPEDVAAVR